jgi:O-antigen/teichoic acid export membrane protein
MEQEIVKKAPSEKKRAFFDFAKMLLANLFHLASGIAVELLIPKLLGYTDYGFYKAFTLYIGYLGLIHFGITDGIYFIYAGKTLTEEVTKKLHSALLFLFLLESGFTLVGAAVSLCFVNVSTYGLVFLLVSIYNVIYNMENCFGFIGQALKKFSLVSLVSIVKSIINIVYVGTCYIIFRHSTALPNFVLFAGLTILISFAADIIYIFKLKQIIFAKGETPKETFADIKNYLLAGLPLLFANLTSNLLMSVDKQFINIFYPVETSSIFSIYSFAYSLLGLITVATSAISSVLFPYMRGKDQEHLIKEFSPLTSALDVFTCFACLAYFFVVWFIGVFMAKYNASLPIFRILLPGLAINTPVVVLMHSYYKALDKEKVYFLQNLVVLMLGILADAGIYYFYIKPYSPTDPIGISITSVGVIFIWYVISESYLVSKYHVKHWKNDFYLMFTVLGFYLFTNFFSLTHSLVYYLIFLVGMSLLFFPKEIQKWVEITKGKLHKKKNSDPPNPVEPK